MVRVRPFPAVCPVPSLASRVASLPYDVVDRDEAARLAADNPLSFLHVVRSEIDLPGTDARDAAVYRRAAENFRRLLADGTLVREEPALYLYRLVREQRSQLGLVCTCHVEDYERNVIRRHEHTRPDKEDDRTRHIVEVGAHTGPVLLACRAPDGFDALARTVTNARPRFHFDAPDGVTHTGWTVQEPGPWVELFDPVPCAYVADGHHRAASALRAARELGAGDAEAAWFLAAIFPADRLTILPYHRVVNDGAARDLARRLEAAGRLAPTDEPQPRRPATFGVYHRGAWQRLELDPASVPRDDPVASLDVQLLQERVLEPAFGITDPRRDPRLDFVGGVHGTGELKRRVDAGEATVAFALYPTTIEQLLTVADAGLVMPPKSTWFEPKLRSGLFVHPL